MHRSHLLRWHLVSICDLTKGFPGDSDGKESACDTEDPGLILWRKE